VRSVRVGCGGSNLSHTQPIQQVQRPVLVCLARGKIVFGWLSTWLIGMTFDQSWVRGHPGLTGELVRHLLTRRNQVILKVRQDSIDVCKFLEDIVVNYRQVQDPERFLEWIANVSALILEQMTFENVSDLVQ
jgi:hypothetical protein